MWIQTSVGERTPIKMCSLQLYEQPCECHLLFLFCRILLVDHIHTLSKYRNPNLPPSPNPSQGSSLCYKGGPFKNVTSWHYIARNSTCILMLIYNKTMSSLPQQRKKKKTRSVLAINWLFFRQWHHCVGWQWLRSLRGSVLVFGAFKRWCWDDLVCECCVFDHSSAGYARELVLTRAVHYRILVKRLSTDFDSWEQINMKGNVSKYMLLLGQRGKCSISEDKISF